MKTILTVVLAGILAMLIGGAAWLAWVLRPAAPLPLEPSSRVSIAQGELIGVADDHGTFAWLGIPYAAPPTGELRWRAPQPPLPWREVLEADRHRSFCMQIATAQVTFQPWRWNRPAGSEDCLYLNIWAPRAALTDAQPRAVMVWIHGGGNTVGEARPYHPARLASEQNVVVVTLNYRLGALGWFSHPALRVGSDDAEDASGNYGTLDLIRALQWVQESSASFGGDPTRVTVFGESAGGRNVVSLLAAPGAAGLFHRAIVQSGLTGTVSRAQAEDPEFGYPGNSGWVARELRVRAGTAANHAEAERQLAAMAPAELAGWLRSVSAKDLLAAYPAWAFGMYRLPQLIRDGHVLPEDDFPTLFADPQRHNVVPVITGTNRDEAKLFMLGDTRLVARRFGFLPAVADPERFARENEYRSGIWAAMAVTELADTLSSGQSESVWAYRFDWDEGHNGIAMDASEVFGAAHGLDIPFVFGDFDGGTVPPGIFSEANLEAARFLSRRMMAYWGAFAREGAPERGGVAQQPRWQSWSEAGAGFMVFDTQADGGLRMAHDVVRVDELKHRLRRDPRYAHPADRCETYATMFAHTRHWQESEYRDLGCGTD